MKITRRFWDRIIIGSVFIILSYFLPIITFILSVFLSINETMERCFRILIGITLWPSLLLEIYPTKYVYGKPMMDMMHAVRNPKVILVNAIGYFIVGYLISLLVLRKKTEKQ
jgi:hypothetical protein